MKNIILISVLGILFYSCQYNGQKEISKTEFSSDKIYQYSVFTALANKIYDGKITVADVKKKGNLGLGTYNGLNGEMIISEGVFFQCLADGTVRVADDFEAVPFAVTKYFNEDKKLEVPAVSSYEEMKMLIEKSLPSRNAGYAFKIKAQFEYLKCGSANKQEKPFTKTLSDALIDRPVFEMENISGTLVGFWYPEYMGKVNVSGFHLHFISDDKKQAGHVIEFSAANLKIGIDICEGFEIKLPQTQAFESADFDLSQKYNNK